MDQPRARLDGSRVWQELARMERDAAWLARRLGRDRTLVFRKITGAVRVSQQELRQIALVLDVPADELVRAAPPEDESADMAAAERRAPGTLPGT